MILAVEEVRRHQKFQGNLGLDGELWDFSGTVGVTNLVCEVTADIGEDMGRDLTKIHLIRLIFCKLAWSRQHSLDGARGEGVISLDDELMSVAADELDVLGVGALAPSELLLRAVHRSVRTIHPDL